MFGDAGLHAAPPGLLLFVRIYTTIGKCYLREQISFCQVVPISLAKVVALISPNRTIYVQLGSPH